jgi:uncharacterized DUF497 family protein
MTRLCMKMTFEEGKTVFNDPFLFTYPDIDSSDTEERYPCLPVIAMF